MCTNIIAMASVDNVDVVTRLTSSIHHDVMFSGIFITDKTAQHISHTMNSSLYSKKSTTKYIYYKIEHKKHNKLKTKNR